MSKYEGLDDKLRAAIFLRDNYRCRWCGSTNRNAYDIHHIRYRRGTSDDVIENLITLCRQHHKYVHDSYRIPKERAQEILWFLASDAGRGQSGIAVFRRLGIAPEVRKGRLLCGSPSGQPLNRTSMCHCGHLTRKHYLPTKGILPPIRQRCAAPECPCETPQTSDTSA